MDATYILPSAVNTIARRCPECGTGFLGGFPGMTCTMGECGHAVVEEVALYSAPIGPTMPTIVDEIVTFLRRFVVFADEAHYYALAYWLISTHSFTKTSPYATPYIYVKSAEPQSGKTRTIEVAALLARAPMTTANASPGALYAAVESRRPTLFLDEVDAVFNGKSNEDLRGMLNSGYKHNGTVERQGFVDGERSTITYSTFCPKLLAGIDNGEIPATIADRCISFDLKRRKLDGTEEIERLIPRKVEPQAEALKARIEHWVNTHAEAIADAEPQEIDGISDRAFEIAEPLLQIAMQIRGETARSREVITHLLSARKPAETAGQKALRVARDLFADGDRDRISSAEFAAAMEMTAPRASRLLTPYGIKTTTVKFPGGAISKGFHRSSFTDAWSRYL